MADTLSKIVFRDPRCRGQFSDFGFRLREFSDRGKCPVMGWVSLHNMALKISSRLFSLGHMPVYPDVFGFRRSIASSGLGAIILSSMGAGLEQRRLA